MITKLFSGESDLYTDVLDKYSIIVVEMQFNDLLTDATKLFLSCSTIESNKIKENRILYNVIPATLSK